MRKSEWCVGFLFACGVVLGALLFFHPRYGQARYAYVHGVQKELVTRLKLTDLCLFTEARYTRHPSQADLFSAFQDHPMALEHFPSGSILRPCLLLRDSLLKEQQTGHSTSP